MNYYLEVEDMVVIFVKLVVDFLKKLLGILAALVVLVEQPLHPHVKIHAVVVCV